MREEERVLNPCPPKASACACEFISGSMHTPYTRSVILSCNAALFANQSLLCSCGWINQHRVRKDWRLQAWLRSEERREAIVHLKTMMLVRRRLADVRVRVWYIWCRYIYIYGVHLRSSINLLCQAFISSNCIFRQIAKHKQIRVFSFIFPIIQINCPRIPWRMVAFVVQSISGEDESWSTWHCGVSFCAFCEVRSTFTE